jgi:superfamily II DNA/RNA helicase
MGAMTHPTSAGAFQALGLRSELLRAVRAAGYEVPTPVQAAVIAAVLEGRDVLARAATGSGKTAAFGLPILQRLLDQPRLHGARGNQVAVLVLAPTRELVMQIAAVLTAFAQSLDTHIDVGAVYGGVKINPQMMALRGGADILVATPGRLLDLHRRNAVKLDQLRSLVLDEADRMLSLGFRGQIEEVLSWLPARRQNLLFAATFSHEVGQWTRALLRSPLEVDLTEVAEGSRARQSQPERQGQIEQHVYTVDHTRKDALLIHLLQQRDLRRVLTFVSAKKTADALVAKLNRADLRAAVFHADKSQRERTRVLGDFRAGKLRVLIATDLAARGIDIDDLPAVINFELPRSPNDYVHRIGRTGRAGKAGLALSLICEHEEQHFRVIEKRMKQRLEREHVAGFEPRPSRPR